MMSAAVERPGLVEDLAEERRQDGDNEIEGVAIWKGGGADDVFCV